jgi:Xaa-Pro aminopeptidase
MTSLSADGCRIRRESLRIEASRTLGCDLLIVADPRELVRLANFYPSPFVFNAVGSGAFLIVAPDRSTLVSDNVARPFLERSHVNEIIAPVWYEGKRSARDRASVRIDATIDAITPFLGSHQRIGVDQSYTPAALIDRLKRIAPAIEIVEIGPIASRERRLKHDDELSLLRLSIAAGEAGFAAALAEIEPGMTEFDAYSIVSRAAMRTLGEPAIVYGDFVSGPRCQKIGGPPSDRVIARGDLFILDFSVVVHGYRGDFANTFKVGGVEPDPIERDRFDLCVEALAAGEAALRGGASAREVDSAVRSVYRDRGFDPKSCFPSHAGHGIGLAHPEPPFIVPESDETLEIGDVVTLEPGFYQEGLLGMRFERNYRIAADGYERLTFHELKLDTST